MGNSNHNHKGEIALALLGALISGNSASAMSANASTKNINKDLSVQSSGSLTTKSSKSGVGTVKGTISGINGANENRKGKSRRLEALLLLPPIAALAYNEISGAVSGKHVYTGKYSLMNYLLHGKSNSQGTNLDIILKSISHDELTHFAEDSIKNYAFHSNVDVERVDQNVKDDYIKRNEELIKNCAVPLMDKLKALKAELQDPELFEQSYSIKAFLERKSDSPAYSSDRDAIEEKIGKKISDVCKELHDIFYDVVELESCECVDFASSGVGLECMLKNGKKVVLYFEAEQGKGDFTLYYGGTSGSVGTVKFEKKLECLQ